MTQNPKSSGTPQPDKESISEEDLDDILAGLGSLHSDIEPDPSLLVDPGQSPTEQPVVDVVESTIESDPALIADSTEPAPDLIADPVETQTDTTLLEKTAPAPVQEKEAQKFSFLGMLRQLFSGRR